MRNLKMYLSNPTLLAKPKAWERLLIYLVVSEVAVSVVLVREEQGNQSPIYYVSKSLLDAETRYPQLEKLALALIMTSRKLRPYFQSHPIVVVTAYPLRNILHKHELSGRLAKCGIDLSEYEITYQPRTAIKSQVLADFVANFSQEMQLEAEKELQVFNGANPGTWTLFTDVSSNVKGAGLGIVLVPSTGETIRQDIKCHSITNNEAEYEAMIAVIQIPRDENVEADALANLASAADVASNANASVIHLFHSVLDPDKNEEIVCDNGPQFIGSQITEFFQSWQIKRITSTPYHLKGNGQGESTNKVIINNLKKRLEESKGETPFSLVYGAEALIPIEIGEPSTRFTQATEESNDEEMRVNLDLLEGRREAALIRMAA
ncbi:uncharacterized protein [Nicotiana sylvestris]|uniref:uncharacterized protein n=1 Tax=Nicotiana sylvestris TaxID=4096 RepID=UPI00388C572A